MEKWGSGFPNYSSKTVFKSIFTEHSQQLKLGPLEAIILVTTLQYELAWQMLNSLVWNLD